METPKIVIDPNYFKDRQAMDHLYAHIKARLIAELGVASEELIYPVRLYDRADTRD